MPREKLYKAWTTPELLKQWFAPPSFTTPVVEIDVRPGGSSRIVMRSADGQEFPNRGVYLEVVPNEKLVFTDAYTEAWKPSQKPFMTVTITFEDEGGKTRYIARARHWTVEDRQAHEKMGFHEGWGICADQLAAVAAKLWKLPPKRDQSVARWRGGAQYDDAPLPPSDGPRSRDDGVEGGSRAASIELLAVAKSAGGSSRIRIRRPETGAS